MEFLSKAIRLCKRTESWLIKVQSRNTSEVTPMAYDTLAPKCIDDSNMQEYFRALKFSLSKENVRNIAITGNYGAGKSTVISSFLKYHCDEKYINVSLAGFDMTENERTVTPTHQEVELSILQQILYKENRDKLPDSRIDRILNRGWHHTFKIYLNLLKFALPMSVFLFFLFFSKTSELLGLPKEWTEIINENYLLRGWGLIALAFTSLFFATQIASRVGIFDKKIRLGKIAFLSGDMEFNDKEPSSLLNNCLDEIVYFFSRRPYKIVVFEDLDRLGTPEIFVKLREINKIINNNRSSKKPVRFIYAVRDDLFVGSDARTKFFDFIIHIVPFMDSRNAYTLLKSKTASLSIPSDVSLKKMASYIGDMRSLQNIANEFQIFCNIVDNSINKTKLFALVFYKNIYALDYHFTDKKTGLLYLFIHNYRTQRLQASYFTSLDNRLNELLTKTQKLNDEIATYPQDIRKDIITSLISEILWGKVHLASKPSHNYIIFNTTELVNSSEYFIDTFMNHGDLHIVYIDDFNDPHFTPIGADIQARVVKDYNDRIHILCKDKNETLYTLREEISFVNDTIRARNATPLADLIKNEGWENFKQTAQAYLNEMESHEFVTAQQLYALRIEMQYGGLNALYMLLSDGLIMQDFMSYRSIFHEGSLSVNDNEFIKAVGQDLDCEKSNQDYYVDDVEKVISELAEQKRLYSDGAFHYQLIEQIIKTNNSLFTDMVASLFRGVDSHIYRAFEIVGFRFVDPGTLEKFVIRALKISDYLMRMLRIMKANSNTAFHDTISIIVLSCISPDNSDEKKEFKNYINFVGSLIIRLIPEDKIDGFCENILKARACYTELFTPGTPTELSVIRFIAENHLYKTTKDNVSIVVLASLPVEHNLSSEEVQKKPWSLIHDYDLRTLQKYYKDNIDEFIQNVFIYSKENSNCITEMLSKKELSDESKEKIVKAMDFTCSNLKNITSKSLFDDGNVSLSLHDLLYKHDRVIPDWISLTDYISGDCNKAILHEWLTKHSSELGQYNSASNATENHKLLYEKIICNDNFDDKTYRNILASVKIDVNHIDDQLSASNFYRLIAMRKLSLDEALYQNVTSVYSSSRDNMTETFVTWFYQYKEVFMSTPDFYLLINRDDSFFEKTINTLMLSNDFNDSDKATLAIRYTEYYLGLDVPDLKIPNTVLFEAINISENVTFNSKLLAVLIFHGYRNKSHLAELCHKVNETDLSNVFLKLTRATISANNDDLAYLILENSRDAGIIKSFEKRADGKFEVSIRRDRDEDA